MMLNIATRTIIQLSVGLLAFTILGSLFPKIEGLFLLHRGSEKLLRAEQQPNKEPLLQSAIIDLQRATMLLPSEPLAWRRLAQALRFAGYDTNSIEALRRASSLQSLLADKDLMIVYLSIGLRNRQLEEELGFDFDKCVAIGDEYLNEGESSEALTWYLRAAQLQPERSNTLLFRRWVAAVQASNSESYGLLGQVLSVYDLSIIDIENTDITVNGSAMRWIPTGTPLNQPYGGPEATFWSNGRGSLFVRVEQAGDYLIRATILNSNPPPIKMAFGVNGRTVQHFTLQKGDNSWEVMEFTTILDSTINTIDFWFLNDEWFPNKAIDRNAVLGRLEIKHIAKR